MLLLQRKKSESPSASEDEDNYVPYVPLRERKKQEVSLIEIFTVQMINVLIL